jgi:SAM-dependent methyltransferase
MFGDRQRWNARYGGGFSASFQAHPIAELALSLPLPDGPMLDLASGPSGAVLLAAATGRPGVAVDVSDVALGLLAREAARRRVAGRVAAVQADLTSWRPRPDSCALVLCTGYWDLELFPGAAQAVLPGGLLGWEAFTTDALLVRPSMPVQWCLRTDEPASLLPAGYDVLSHADVPDSGGARRRMLARRSADRAAGGGAAGRVCLPE